MLSGGEDSRVAVRPSRTFAERVHDMFWYRVSLAPIYALYGAFAGLYGDFTLVACIAPLCGLCHDFFKRSIGTFAEFHNRREITD